MNVASERLSLIMQEKNISCRKLAELTGITKSSISNYANGLRAIPLEKLNAMAAALGVSAAWLIGWTDDRFYDVEAEKPAQTDELSFTDLSDEEIEFISIFSRLSPENRKLLLANAKVYLQAQGDSSDLRD